MTGAVGKKRQFRLYHGTVLLLQGKTILITGLRDRKSIAFEVARLALAQGARVIVTAQPEYLSRAQAAIGSQPRNGAMATHLSSTQAAVDSSAYSIPVLPLDITSARELAGLRQALAAHQVTSLDGIVHSIAFADRRLLGGSLLREESKKSPHKCQEQAGTSPKPSDESPSKVTLGAIPNSEAEWTGVLGEDRDGGRSDDTSTHDGEHSGWGSLIDDGEPCRGDRERGPDDCQIDDDGRGPDDGLRSDWASLIDDGEPSRDDGEFAAVSRAFQVSTYSYKALIDSVLPIIKPGGSVVGLTFESRFAWPNYNWMGVNKSALESLNRYLARDLARYQIRSNLVSAGPVLTSAASGIPGMKEFAAHLAARAPLDWNPTNAEPVARAVIVLLSDWLPMTTGDIVYVDGGAHAVAVV